MKRATDGWFDVWLEGYRNEFCLVRLKPEGAFADNKEAFIAPRTSRRRSLNKPAVGFLVWEPRYAVHVATIDTEHQVWFALINGVHQAVINGKGKDILRTALAETTQYTFSHFAHEEELMDEIDYPEREEHILSHRVLSRRTREFTDRLEKGQSAPILEYLVFLSDWVKLHTTTIDRKLGSYVQARRME
jgi:hemerythrin-like metal-binding protein